MPKKSRSLSYIWANALTAYFTIRYNDSSSVKRQLLFFLSIKPPVRRRINKINCNLSEITHRRVANGCSDASGGAWAYMAISKTPVIRTRKRRTLLIHPLGMLPTILASLQINETRKIAGTVAKTRESNDCVRLRRICRFTANEATITISLTPKSFIVSPWSDSVNWWVGHERDSHFHRR